MSARAQTFQRACRIRLLSSSHPESNSSRINQNKARTAHTGAGKTTSSGTSRRAITVTSDDGRYSWSELSTGEKAARTTQQSFNFLFVGAGAIGTIAVAYLLYAELFAADSKTRQFNRAVDRVKGDASCRELLGPANKITAYGEPTSSKWARARPLAHSTEVDRYGTEHFRMHFNAEGPDGRGIVSIHMTRRPDQDELEYKLLSLSVPGHPTIYLENRDTKGSKSVAKIFGYNWK